MSFKSKQKGLPVVYFPKLGKILRLTTLRFEKVYGDSSINYN